MEKINNNPNDYKTFTNAELENELERLTNEYKFAQNVVLENYQLMMELSELYKEVNGILDTRTGKVKEG